MKNQLELIDEYLEGKLSGKALQDFEERLKSDPSLASEVNQMRTLNRELASFQSRKKLKEKLNSFHKELEPVKENIKVISFKDYYRSLAIAASIAIVASLGSIAYWKISKDSDKAHYRELRMDLDIVKQSHNQLWQAIKDEKIYPSNIQSSGTAFAISADGYIITSHHVIKGAESIFIRNHKFKRLKVKPIFDDPLLDVAILKVDDPSFKTFGKIPYSFQSSVKDLGNRVYTLGYPREDIVYGEGYVSSLTGYEGDTVAYQVAIPVNPGNSGGPLLDEWGNIIGIVGGKHTEEEGAAFAIKTRYLKRLVKKLKKEKIKLSTQGSLAGVRRPYQIKKVERFVFQIQALD
jgi:S1-C subfamily serine protease